MLLTDGKRISIKPPRDSVKDSHGGSTASSGHAPHSARLMQSDLGTLRAAATVAETLSFAAAAKKLFISRSGLSEKISHFEERIGIPLFDRSTRHVKLTYHGSLLLAHIRLILAQVELADFSLNHCRETPPGASGANS